MAPPARLTSSFNVLHLKEIEHYPKVHAVKVRVPAGQPLPMAAENNVEVQLPHGTYPQFKHQDRFVTSSQVKKDCRIEQS